MQGDRDTPAIRVRPRPGGETIVEVGTQTLTVPATGDPPPRPNPVPPVLWYAIARESLINEAMRERAGIDKELQAAGRRIDADPGADRVRIAASAAEADPDELFALVEKARERGVTIEVYVED